MICKKNIICSLMDLFFLLKKSVRISIYSLNNFLILFIKKLKIYKAYFIYE
jgi:hypothetical protein